MALTNKLSAIGDAIREKAGTTEKLTLDEMPIAIASISSGGGDVEPVVITGFADYSCSGAVASKYIELYGDKVSTNNIAQANYMFYRYNGETIPFDINCDDTGTYTSVSGRSMFEEAQNLKIIPRINKMRIGDMQSMFRNCKRLRYLPEDINSYFKWDYIDNSTSNTVGSCMYMFCRCQSLRKIPSEFLSHKNNSIRYSAYIYNGGFDTCYVLDELIGLQVPTVATWTSNAFQNTFYYCGRLSDIIFETNADGTPLIAKWKSQTIDLTSKIGYVISSEYVLNYNSGITVDKLVQDDVAYQALKNDPDWFTTLPAYSRYNHDSAVRTINSLPDTSAYLASSGGTNTIKFLGAAGANTDGGAINTLTEEEIAVATAKGWTVALK
jgi:hypothetical protein